MRCGSKLGHLRKKHAGARKERNMDYKVKWKDRYPGVGIHNETEEEYEEVLRQVDI